MAMASIRNTNIVLMMFILFIQLHTHFAKHTKQVSNCIESERKALIEFKGSLIDEDNMLSSWRGRDCCSWYGIICHNLTGFVQTLDLSNVYSLGGEINSSLVNLEHLEYLDLSYNRFKVLPIPEFLGSLRNLQYLNLDGVGFGGEIPQQLGNLSNLQHLILGDDEYYHNSSVTYYSLLTSKSLNWITGLSSLKSLQFSGLNLRESVDWLDSVNMLSSLSSLTLRGCGLTVSSNSYSYHDNNLTSLVSLDLSYNYNLTFNTLPSWLFNLTHLQHLSFSNSLSSSLPDSVCNLTSLNLLDLSKSNLEGPLPVCLGNLTSLTSLFLGRNNLSGEISGELSNLTRLTVLDLKFNHLSGEIPGELGYLTKLTNLDLSDNLFNSSILSTFGQLQDLESLYLSNNMFSGTLPSTLEKLTKLSSNFLNGSVPTFENSSLSILIVSGNRISGNIPEELCDLKSLTILSLANNQLTGRIPLCLGNLRQLQQLDLGNNGLYGLVPNEFGYLEQLQVLHLNGNKFFGELPSSLQSLTSLRTLDLGNNELNGSIPAWIGKEFSNLQYLRLESNHFSGPITLNLCQLLYLQILNLAHNNLAGTIPSCLGNLSTMLSEKSSREESSDSIYVTPTPVFSTIYTDKLLNIVKGNELEYTSNLRYAKFISLSSNNLYGEIPDELMDLKGLKSLNLSNNNLSGRIPKKIGNLKNLESLDLSVNRISGTIPQSLVDIDTLSYLNLSFNDLRGRIPTGNHFDTLEYNSSVYEGNRVCGKPLTRSCPGDLVISNKQNGHDINGDNNEFEFSWYYGGIVTGFAIGFLGIMCILCFNKSWRSAYFDFLENVYNRVWVALTIKIFQFRRKFN